MEVSSVEFLKEKKKEKKKKRKKKKEDEPGLKTTRQGGQRKEEEKRKKKNEKKMGVVVGVCVWEGVGGGWGAEARFQKGTEQGRKRTKHSCSAPEERQKSCDCQALL